MADRSLSARAADIGLVVDQLGLPRFAIDASNAAGLETFTYVACNAERVSHLVLADAHVRGPGKRDHPSLQLLRGLAEIDWNLFTNTLALLALGWTEEARQWGEHIRRCMSREDYLAFVKADWEVDLAPLLPTIATPALVCSSSRFAHVVRPDLARQLVSSLPNARLVSVRDANEKIRVVEEFLGDAPTAPLPPPIHPLQPGASAPSSSRTWRVTRR